MSFFHTDFAKRGYLKYEHLNKPTFPSDPCPDPM